MKSVAITHLCGDPYVTLFWLHMYKKYWRGEIDKLNVYITFNQDVLPPQSIDIQRKVLEECPEIAYQESFQGLVPENTNSLLLKDTTEDVVFLIETDSFIFKSGWVLQNMISPIVNGAYDIVGTNYRLMEPQISPNPNILGFMRNIFSCRNNILQETDLDFFPRHHPPSTINKHTTSFGCDFDCFGWMSYQLLTLTNRIYLHRNANMINSPDQIINNCDFSTYPYVHVRQFNSSFLGLFQPIWKALRDNDQNFINKIQTETQGQTPPKWYFEKAIAFRLMFLEFFRNVPELEEFKKDYIHVLEQTMQIIQTNKDFIYRIKNFFLEKFKPGE